MTQFRHELRKPRGHLLRRKPLVLHDAAQELPQLVRDRAGLPAELFLKCGELGRSRRELGATQIALQLLTYLVQLFGTADQLLHPRVGKCLLRLPLEASVGVHGEPMGFTRGHCRELDVPQVGETALELGRLASNPCELLLDASLLPRTILPLAHRFSAFGDLDSWRQLAPPSLAGTVASRAFVDARISARSSSVGMGTVKRSSRTSAAAASMNTNASGKWPRLTRLESVGGEVVSPYLVIHCALYYLTSPHYALF